MTALARLQLAVYGGSVLQIYKGLAHEVLHSGISYFVCVGCICIACGQSSLSTCCQMTLCVKWDSLSGLCKDLMAFPSALICTVQ